MDGSNSLFDREVLLTMMHRIMRIRYFEEAVLQLKADGTIPGAAHSYIGEEAVAVGACAALRPDDWMTGNHRSHGHPIAKGGDVKRAMAELLGKSTGYCKGKGGSMHLADFSIGILGESGILGSSIPVAVGAALACKQQHSDRVAMCFFGDGASNQGAFHESMNLASIWSLPVIFLCENNQYAQTTSYKKVIPTENIADRAPAYNMPGVVVDGQDALAVYEATSQAVLRARNGDGPSLVECLTYRYYEHSAGMERVPGILNNPYRSQEEMDYWKGRDPLKIHRQMLLDADLATNQELEEIEQQEREGIQIAIQFAHDSPYPAESELTEDMFAEPIEID